MYRYARYIYICSRKLCSTCTRRASSNKQQQQAKKPTKSKRARRVSARGEKIATSRSETGRLPAHSFTVCAVGGSQAKHKTTSTAPENTGGPRRDCALIPAADHRPRNAAWRSLNRSHIGRFSHISEGTCSFPPLRSVPLALPLVHFPVFIDVI